MKRITVFTPTFNRGELLIRLFNSLNRQTSKEFKWLIIDDGSEDNTKDLVEGFKNKSNVEIDYHFQMNGGMVYAHQKAHELMDTELCVCIDSDDWIPEDGIEKILKLWDEFGDENSAGLIGLDSFEDGNVIGNEFPESPMNLKFTEMQLKYKVYGDKKFVHNRKVFNKFLPYKFFKDEKFPVTSYLYHFIEQKHKWVGLNEVFCVVEYQQDGLSANLIKQYRTSPNSWAHYRLTRMKLPYNYKDRFKNTIHYVSSSLLANNYNFFQESPYKLTTFFSIPFGFFLYLYIRYTSRGALNKNLNTKG